MQRGNFEQVNPADLNPDAKDYFQVVREPGASAALMTWMRRFHIPPS